MIIFKYHKTKDSEDSFSFEFDENSTIYELKQHIIQNFYSKEENVRYIDVEYIGDRIIRGFGKLTLEKGVISRHMDSQKFTRYSLANREIDICMIKKTKFIEELMFYKSSLKDLEIKSEHIFVSLGFRTFGGKMSTKGVNDICKKLSSEIEEDFSIIKANWKPKFQK